MLICYDPADNIHGLGAVTMYEKIVGDIQTAAVSSTKVEVAIVPSRAENSPVQAHSFADNEATDFEEKISGLYSALEGLGGRICLRSIS
jgi:hypothetical protein